MSEQKVPRSVEQHIVIKFLVRDNTLLSEIHHRLQQQYREEYLSQTRVFENCEFFREGKERVENESLSRRLRTSITQPNNRLFGSEYTTNQSPFMKRSSEHL
ncbi:hypothetical protein AVEN_66236-1 [Araneus ventricosus]|uniref:Mos1 transposase HTH domain-containing protein n=1 Tax=Araneus ventricosus TaxID=182803 RepID=A0A4Y2I5Y4_ARAVE|nr:hypothetical protein AVEN_66236-1 [Araneus ventricosus]